MTLDEHRRAINTVNQQRRLLDMNYAKIVADAIADGFTISEILEILPYLDTKTKAFDL